VIDQAEAVATITLSESLAAITDAVRLFAEAAFTSVHVAQRRLHAVHSALVVHAGAGLLLRGPSGAGKSTLTYSCLRAGMHMVSDDWVYAPAGRPVAEFAGYPWRMMMTREAAARFPELADVELVPHTSAEGWKVPVVPPADQRHATHRVDAVVLLDPSSELELRRAEPEEALQRFWDASLPVEREHLDPTWVDDLLSRPTHVLHRGTSPDAAARLLQELAERCPTSC
jgi:energy-coupling factor transporter ATP-binding protein EcfA2